MTKNQQTRLETYVTEMEEQVKRMNNSWLEVAQDVLAEDDKKFDEIDAENDEVKKEMKKARQSALELIDKRPSTNTDPNIGTTIRATKIDDTLKPKEILQRSMTLEEFNVWSIILKFTHT